MGSAYRKQTTGWTALTGWRGQKGLTERQTSFCTGGLEKLRATLSHNAAGEVLLMVCVRAGSWAPAVRQKVPNFASPIDHLVQRFCRDTPVLTAPQWKRTEARGNGKSTLCFS